MVRKEVSQEVVMDEIEGTVDEFRQTLDIDEHLLFPHDARYSDSVRLVAGDRLRYSPMLTIGQELWLLRVVTLTLEDSGETQTRLAIYGQRQSPGCQFRFGYKVVRFRPIPADQIQDAWSKIELAMATGSVWSVSKSAEYPVLFLTCDNGQVEWRQID